MVKPAARRMIVNYFKESYQMSERQACRLISLSLNSSRYQAKSKASDELAKLQLVSLAKTNIRYGYRRLRVCLASVGFIMNHKKVYRLYKEADLVLSRKKSKKLKQQRKVPMKAANYFNECWSIDFISDKLTDYRKLRCLNVIDNYSRFSISLEVANSMPTIKVIAILKKAISKYGKPESLILDNGPEFTSKLFQAWAASIQMNLHFIDPGKPTQNAYVESFNGKFRDECLNQYWFSSIKEAQIIITNWQNHYNNKRPHSSLGYLPPKEFIKKNSCNNSSLRIA